MTNREKLAEQILDIACDGGAVTLAKGNLRRCDDVSCMQCDFCFSSDIDDVTSCREMFKSWCNSEYIEKPKISESDRRFLDYLPSKEAWMVRDKNGHLYLFCGNKPCKYGIAWYNETDDYIWLNKLFNIDFSMVKWEDEEPWLIEDLKNLEVEDE